MAEEPPDQIDWGKGNDVGDPPQHAIRVYTNRLGEVVVAQDSSDPLGGDFPIIVIRREDLRTVIEALTREADLAPAAV
ncbi:hypothetical protein [uncultured Phenylobacterium sp.]|uniref:hypothetical protein n=1 Tax=uncultured Phenylobacterium sp. TaxID=349273 RepID=UPI0025E462F5|nr:hypothetical protein [uncultured Phenylobacterium sp.]